MSEGKTPIHKLRNLMLSPAKAIHRHTRSSDSHSSDSTSTPSSDPIEYTDTYGFSHTVTASQHKRLLRCTSSEDSQREKWAPWPPSQATLPPPDRLKKLCRAGIPPELRPWVWMEVSGAAARRAAHHHNYFSAMARLGRHESPYAHQIDLDTPRTFPTNEWVQSQPGQVSLCRVLLAFAQHNPQVGYCQGMNYLAAMLLVSLNKDEEAAFWVLASLIADDDKAILYQGMYASDLTGTHVEMRSLRELVDVKLPRLANHLDDLKCDMSLLATDWFLCLFATALPPECAARVWDALFNEGPKVLFRVALALLKIAEVKLLERDNPGEVLRAARAAANEQYDRDALMRAAFDGIGTLPMGAIRRYRAVNQREVDYEFAERETRANLRAAVKNGFVVSDDEAAMLERPVGGGSGGGAGGMELFSKEYNSSNNTKSSNSNGNGSGGNNGSSNSGNGVQSPHKKGVFQLKSSLKETLDRSKLVLDKAKNEVKTLAHRRVKSIA